MDKGPSFSRTNGTVACGIQEPGSLWPPPVRPGQGFIRCRFPRSSHFKSMKSWVLALIVCATCASILIFIVLHRVIPAFYANANVECIADWHSALAECRRDTGSWPDPADKDDFMRRVFVVKDSNGKAVRRGYMTGRPWAYRNGVAYDAYDRPIRLSQQDEQMVVSSSGANGIWGDQDDVSSDTARERYQPTSLEQAKEQAEAEILKKKSR